MKKELEEIRRRRENNKQQHATSSADYGVDNSNNNEEEEENKDDDPQAKFGYSDDGTVNGPLGHYDAKVGHIVYEPWEYELHANLVKWNEEAKQKGVRDREHKGGNRQF
jgi:hypothetical protein